MVVPIRTCIGCKKTDEADKLHRWFCRQPENKTELIAHIKASDHAIRECEAYQSAGFLWTKTHYQLNLPTGWYFIGKMHRDARHATSEIIPLSNFDDAIVEELLATLEFGIFSPVIKSTEQILSGRGAWLHPQRICLHNAINHRAFQRSLKRDSTVWIDLSQFLLVMENSV